VPLIALGLPMPPPPVPARQAPMRRGKQSVRDLLAADSATMKTDPLNDMTVPFSSVTIQAIYRPRGFHPVTPHGGLEAAAKVIQWHQRAAVKRRQLLKARYVFRMRKKAGHTTDVEEAATRIQARIRTRLGKKQLVALQDERDEREVEAYRAKKKEQAMMRQSTFKPVHKHSEYEMAVKKIDAARKQSAAAKEPPPAAKREVKFARKSVVGANARPESIHRKTTASAPLAAATITEEAASATPPPPPTLDSRPTIEAVLELDVDKRRSEVARQLEDAFSAAVSDAMFALPADPVAFVLAHALRAQHATACETALNMRTRK